DWPRRWASWCATADAAAGGVHSGCCRPAVAESRYRSRSAGPRHLVSVLPDGGDVAYVVDGRGRVTVNEHQVGAHPGRDPAAVGELEAASGCGGSGLERFDPG